MTDGNGGVRDQRGRMPNTQLLVAGIVVGMLLGILVGSVFLDNVGLGLAFGLFFGIVGAVIVNEFRRLRR